MPTSLRDKVVLITGAASGLGRQLALELAREGAAIAAIDLQAGPLQVLCEEMGSRRAGWAVADVGDGTGLSATVNALERALGPVDVLIANAGVGTETPALAFCPGDLERQVRVNLLGVANSIGAVLPGMLRRGRGQLVAISSLASYRGLPRMAGYCASKAGVNALMDAVRVEVRPYGIDVTTICPGWIRTPLTENINVPKPDLLEVDEAARRIVEAIRLRRPFYAFPARVARRVGLCRWLPVRLSDWALTRVLRSLARNK